MSAARRLLAAAGLLVAGLAALAAPGARPALAAKAAPAAPAYVVPKPVERELKNQLKLYVIEDHRLPMVHYRFVVRAGAAHEPAEKAGLASLMLETMRMGTAKHDAKAFAEAVDALGGDIDVNATRDYMAITGQFLSRDWRQGLDLVSEMIQTPTFAKAEVERSRSQALAAIQASRDDNSTVASEHATALVYGEHPYARPVQGDAGSVQAITRNDLVRFHETYFRPNLCLLVVVGDVDAEQVRSDVEARFRDWEKAEPPSRPGPPLPQRTENRIRLIDKPEVTQAELRLGYEGVPRNTPDFFAVQVMNYILGGGGFSSRLTLAARSKGGMTYDVSSGFDMGLDKGAFFISTFTRNATVAPMIDVLLQTTKDFQAQGPTPQEVDEARRFLLGSLPLALQSARGLAAQWAAVDLYGLGTDYFDRYAERLDAVTVADVKAAADKYLRTDKLTIVAVTTADSVKGQLDKYGPVETVDYRSPTGSIPQSKPTESVPEEILSPESVARAQAVIDRGLKAHGGAARLKALKDLSSRSTVTLSTPNGSIEGGLAMTIALPSRSRIEMNLLGQRGVQVLDGDRAWATQGGQVQDLDQEQTAAMRAGLKVQVLPLLSRLARGELQVGYLGDDVIGRDTVDVVQIVDPDAMTKASFSRSTGLLVRLEQEEPAMFGGGRVPMARLYSDHRTVDGYVVPFRTERLARGQKVVDDRVTELKINRGAAESLFLRPSR